MKNKFFKKCLEIAVIVIGNAILAFGICAFITPHGIIVGGASGLGLNCQTNNRNSFIACCLCNQYYYVYCRLFFSRKIFCS